MAWTELKTARHESDILEILMAAFSNRLPPLMPPFDLTKIEERVLTLGAETERLWKTLKDKAQLFLDE